MTKATVNDVKEVFEMAKTNRVIRQLLELAILTQSATKDPDNDADYSALDHHIANYTDDALWQQLENCVNIGADNAIINSDVWHERGWLDFNEVTE